MVDLKLRQKETEHQGKKVQRYFALSLLTMLWSPPTKSHLEAICNIEIFIKVHSKDLLLTGNCLGSRLCIRSFFWRVAESQLMPKNGEVQRTCADVR